MANAAHFFRESKAMKRMQNAWVIALAIGCAQVATVSADELVASDKLQSVVALQGVSENDGVVSGQVVNLSGRRLENINLSVTYGWRWKNERHPGNDGPGWMQTVIVPSLQPHAAQQFTATPNQAWPQRADGAMAVSVKVLGLTEYREAGDQ